MTPEMAFEFRTRFSASSLLRPYGSTGEGDMSSVTGMSANAAGPAAACDETNTKRATPARSAASSTRAVSATFDARSSARVGARVAPAA